MWILFSMVYSYYKINMEKLHEVERCWSTFCSTLSSFIGENLAFELILSFCGCILLFEFLFFPVFLLWDLLSGCLDFSYSSAELKKLTY